MKLLRIPPMYKCIGLIDADLLDKGSRHPNLALLKIAGFLFDNHIPFELILDYNSDFHRYERIYLSKVFTFTKLPDFLEDIQDPYLVDKIVKGGTGFYANAKGGTYRYERETDMIKLENDSFLITLLNHRGGHNRMGINMARQMPYYHLYDAFVDQQVALGFKREKYKDYYNYSIGFLTRGCVRHCPFCINKYENIIHPYSKIDWFLDQEKDVHGHDKRKYIYLWDDNFLASDKTIWKPLLEQLIATKKPFQFRQGLDERMLAESPDGEEMAELLSKARYHGDFIFAFDNWKDRDIIVKALKIWKHYNPKKSTKFYLFCGFKQTKDNKEKFYNDIWELFQRIKILMQYGCVGYVMRHEDYHQAPIANIYIQIARWCNQQAFYKKMSFWEFCYRNQSYWEEHSGILNRPKQKSYKEFEEDINIGYYDSVKMCLPLVSIKNILAMFPSKKDELLEMFNYKMEKLISPSLWEHQ